ncbi:hypothetical protein [Vallitalea guaymasensis]|uniref:Uncharacterized protein n=1 Tax=Vallitalea guaymasensis TaxID=1185412 RepID=A0A8J8M7V5_9FIRM|nr:hypothetical protein [Vallitalea guaymasensis]QUH27987.1 hypothetical protein HYG85_03270 [Vallitalea guaymasensis]
MILSRSKRKSCAILLAVAMILTMMPLTAKAAAPTNVEVYLSGATNPNPTVNTQDGDTVESIYTRITGQSYPWTVLYEINGKMGAVAPGSCIVPDNAYIQYYTINNYQTDVLATISDYSLIIADGKIKVLNGKEYTWKGLEKSINMCVPFVRNANVTVNPKNLSTPLTTPVKLSDYAGIEMKSTGGISTYMPIEVVADYDAYTTELNEGLEKVIAIADSFGINTSSAVNALNGSDNAVKATEKVALGETIINASINNDILLSKVTFNESVAVSAPFDPYVPSYTLISTTGSDIVPATFIIEPVAMASDATVTYSTTDSNISFAGNVISASTAGNHSFSIKVAKNGAERIYDFAFTCDAPIVAGDPSVYAFLPAPGQFTNEGVTVGGWGDIYLSGTDGIKLMADNVSSTGVSLGYFGGYTVFDMKNIDNDPNNKYGVDFIVYGNAFWNNSEPGCIQVAQADSQGNPDTWYDIAGSLYYENTTKKNFSLTYENPNPNDNTKYTEAGNNLGKLDSINYTGSATGTITKNTFHNHSWFPLNCNYFTGRNGNPALDKTNKLSFADYNDSHNKLTLTGTMLGSITSTNTTTGFGFGYCDVHPNGSGDKSIAYNPYGVAAITSTFNYNTYINGTGGGDPIDISWAVDANGNPVNLDNIRFVRIYTGAAAMNGIFGEISTEVCGIKKATGTGDGEAVTGLPTVIDYMTDLTVTTSNMSTQTVTLEDGIVEYELYSIADNVYVNGTKVTCDDTTPYELSLTLARGDIKYVQIITQNGAESPYITVFKFVYPEV